MIRKIIQIDEEKCNGCGACAKACHEGAIGMIHGKAKLLRDDYCDGLGDCLPSCPTGAITFIEREAEAYDEQAVENNMEKKKEQTPTSCSCAGQQAKKLQHGTETPPESNEKLRSHLTQWPVQIKLAPINAPYFNNAHLLVAADCSAYAYAGFHKDFMKNKITLIGCPKLDAVNYAEKLTAIIAQNDIKSVTLVRMEVPCCGGLEHALKNSLMASGKFIPWQVVTISSEGDILDT